MTHAPMLAGLLTTLSIAATAALAADDPLVAQPAAPIERAGPTANGDAKPFRAFDQADCEGSVCVADFGKKGNKVRTIEWVSCGINTNGGILQLAQVLFTDTDVPVAFIPAVSRAVNVAGEVAILEFTQTFQVPAGEFFRVQMVTDGDALGSQCIVAGTIG